MTNKTKKTQFTQVPSKLVKDKEISLAAKGLFAFMQDKPDGWNFTIKSMAKQLKEGESAIRSCLIQLKEEGWLTYEKHKDGKGTYQINFTPVVTEPKRENQYKADPEIENPNVENPNEGFPMMGNSTRIKQKDSLNRQIDKHKDSNGEASPTKKMVSGLDISSFTNLASEDSIKNWIQHRKAIKKPMSQRALDLSIKNFAKVADELSLDTVHLKDGAVINQIDQLIDYTIEAGWQSVKSEWVQNREAANQNRPKPNGYAPQLAAEDLGGEW